MTCAKTLVACLVMSVALGAQKAPPAAAAFVTTSSGSMFTVSRLLVEDTWIPLLDKRIQESPAARGLGASWQPSDPRWQKARAALGARMSKIFAAYQGSNELQNHIETEVGKIPAGKDLDAAVAAIKGPAGAAIIRQQAKRTYIVHAMTADGPAAKGPAIGSPEWNTQMREMDKRFDVRAGSGVPADDPARKADVEKLFADRGVAEVLRRVWDFGVGNATRQLNTALNLMVFDDQDAIEKEIAAAIGRGGPGAQAPAAPAFPLEQMATCKDSWLEWGADESKVGAYRDGFKAQFKPSGNDPFFVPVTSATLMGMKVTRVYSNTVGMGRGFSVTVEASFDSAKKAIEKSIGQSLKHCETCDGMRTCDLELGEKKTVMLLADAAGKEKTVLLGCYYFYEK